MDEIGGDAGLRLVNISTRAMIGEGDNQAIPGFIIAGDEPLKVLVKAAGRSLQAFGVNTSLDPKLQVVRMSDNRVVAENDDWQDAPRQAEIPDALRPTHSQDAAVLLDLNPGVYTALVAPVSGVGQIGLVSIDVLQEPTATSQFNPDLNFLSVEYANPGTSYTSNSVSIDGLNSGERVAASVSNGATLVINAVDSRSASGEVQNGDSLALQAVSPAAGQSQDFTLDIAGHTGTWTISSAAEAPANFSGTAMADFDAPLSGATLALYNENGELLGEYSEATGANGEFALAVADAKLQQLAYLKAYGGDFNGAAYQGELIAVCPAAATCNPTPYSSLLNRLSPIYDPSNPYSTESLSRAGQIIKEVLGLEQEPSFASVDLSSWIDLSQWQTVHADSEHIAVWYDRVAADITDGYLDDAELQSVLIGAQRRPNFKLSVSGKGEVRSADGSIVVDTRQSAENGEYSAQLAADSGLELTATPADGYQILYWSGCNLVSDDKTRCALRFDGAPSFITVTFGVTDPEVVSNVFDLTEAAHVVDGALYTLTAAPTDSDMQQTLAGIQANDYIVSVRDGGFLRRVTAAQALSATEYQYTTDPALLEDVIKRGTLAYRNPLDINQIESLEVYDGYSGAASQLRSVAAQQQDRAALEYLQQLPPGAQDIVATSTPGVYMQRGRDADELTLIFGEPENKAMLRSLSAELTEQRSFVIYDKDKDKTTTGDQLRLTGTLTFKITADLGAQFDWGGIDSLKFIIEADTKQNLTFEGDFSGLFSDESTYTQPKLFKISKDEEGKPIVEKGILDINMKALRLSIGPVPVYMEPRLLLSSKIGLDNTAGIKTSISFELAQRSKGGFHYVAGAVDPWEFVTAFDHNEKIDFKPIEATLEMFAGVQLEAGIKLYKVIGLNAYGLGGIKTQLTAGANFDGATLGSCPVKVNAKIYGLADVGFTVKASIDPEVIFLGELEDFNLSRSLSIYKKTWPLFAAEATLGTAPECGWQAPPKLEVEGPDSIITAIDFTSGYPTLTYDYTVTNVGSVDMDWSIKPARLDDNIQFIEPDGTATSEIFNFGLKKDQSYSFQLRLDTKDLQPTASDSLGAKLLSFATRGLSDLASSLIAPTYRNKLVFTNETDKTLFPGWFTDETKGNRKLPLEVTLPVPPFSTAPTLLSATPEGADRIRLQWQYTAADFLLRGQGFTFYTENTATTEEVEEDYFGILSPEMTTTHEYVVSGLQADTLYEFSLEAFGENTWSPLSNSLQARTLSADGKLPAPDNFSVTPGDGQVQLRWDAVTEANGYQIAQRDAAGSIETVNSDTTRYVISGLINGDSYEYSVVALDADGNRGVHSTVLSVTPQAAAVSSGSAPLNDTGITWGGEYPSGNNSTCTGETISEQDCSHGRDATHNDDSDGHAGFSFSKIDGGRCVLDNVTGLIWEVKQGGNGTRGDEGLHDADDTYNWYDTNPATNGGADGYADDDGAICYGYQSANSSTYCNTQAFVARVNAAGWCGYTDWRMPNREELRSIVDYSRTNPAIDTNYFPNTQFSYWSGSPNAYDSSSAWNVNFGFGYDGSNYRYNNLHVRLVRGGQ